MPSTKKSNKRRSLGVLSCLLTLAAGCEGPAGHQSPRMADVKSSGRSVDLGDLVTNVAAGNYRLDTLHATVSLQDESAPGFVADVAEIENGNFAVLDRINCAVVIYNQAGQRIREFGRKGEGPGEYSQPYALTSIGRGRLVVWDAHATKTFTVVDTLGVVHATAGRQVGGDWLAAVSRSSLYRLEYPFTAPWEDLTRRLAVDTSVGFTFYLQDDERDRRLQKASLSEHGVILRFDSVAHLVDTLAAVAAPPSRPDAKRPMTFEQPVHAGRPLWAVGQEWWALGHGDSSRITVYNADDDSTIELHLRKERTAISDDDKEAYVRWHISEVVNKTGTARTRSLLNAMSFLGRRKMTRAMTEGTWFANDRPLLTAMFAAGNCLWLSGFNANDSPEGVSRSWLAVHRRTGKPIAAVTLPLPAVRIREISKTAAFTTHRSDDGVVILQRHSLPAGMCTR